MRRGAIYAATAYALWGLFPLYFHAVADIPALEITAHRVVWSLLFMAVLMVALRRTAWLRPALADRRVLRTFIGSSALLAANWFIYVWAVTHGHVIEASLGYFINPLFNVLLGRVVLGERLRPAQLVAVTLAALGVGWITWQSGALPWIALALAASFGTYGLLRKTASIGTLEGLTLESLVLGPVALAGLLWAGWQGHTTFQHADTGTQWLLVAAGPLTAIPLIFFGAAAPRIPMSLLGMLQYIGPTLQLAIGVWFFNEPFGGARAQGFALIWLACAVFSAELAWRNRRLSPPLTAPATPAATLAPHAQSQDLPAPDR